ncbi:hypothetical protein Tco_1455467, partial [Tanacetum coccineum]
CGIPLNKKKSKAGQKNRSTLVDGQVSKHTAGSIRIDQHRLQMEKERGGPDKYSDLMEEKYGADRECHPRVSDREIWERACGGPCKKGRFLDLVPPMDLDLALTGTPSTPSTGNSYAHQSSVASSEEVCNMFDPFGLNGHNILSYSSSVYVS